MKTEKKKRAQVSRNQSNWCEVIAPAPLVCYFIGACCALSSPFWNLNSSLWIVDSTFLFSLFCNLESRKRDCGGGRRIKVSVFTRHDFISHWFYPFLFLLILRGGNLGRVNKIGPESFSDLLQIILGVLYFRWKSEGVKLRVFTLRFKRPIWPERH